MLASASCLCPLMPRGPGLAEWVWSSDHLVTSIIREIFMMMTPPWPALAAEYWGGCSPRLGNVMYCYVCPSVRLSVCPSVRPFQNWISHCLPAYDSLWQLMTTYDNLWQLMTAYDNLWRLMTTYDSLWQLMTTYDNLRQLMTAYDSLWQLMTTYDNFWQLLTSYDNLWQLFTLVHCTLCKLSSSQDLVAGLVYIDLHLSQRIVQAHICADQYHILRAYFEHTLDSSSSMDSSLSSSSISSLVEYHPLLRGFFVMSSSLLFILKCQPRWLSYWVLFSLLNLTPQLLHWRPLGLYSCSMMVSCLSLRVWWWEASTMGRLETEGAFLPRQAKSIFPIILNWVECLLLLLTALIARRLLPLRLSMLNWRRILHELNGTCIIWKSFCRKCFLKISVQHFKSIFFNFLPMHTFV